MQVKIVGMSWYRPDTYARLRAIFEDGEKLPRTYEEWLVAAENGRKSMGATGVRVVCVDIDPDEFPKWCTANGMKLNAEARQRYGAMIAYQVATSPDSGPRRH